MFYSVGDRSRSEPRRGEMFRAFRLVPLLTELGDPRGGGYYIHRTPTGLSGGTLSYALNCRLSSPTFNYTLQKEPHRKRVSRCASKY